MEGVEAETLWVRAGRVDVEGVAGGRGGCRSSQAQRTLNNYMGLERKGGGGGREGGGREGEQGGREGEGGK